jgi:hypothetical protein
MQHGGITMADGRNVSIEIQGSKLVITCDLAKDFGPSKSGKTVIIASTDGNMALPGDEKVRLGLNLYRTR